MKISEKKKGVPELHPTVEEMMQNAYEYTAEEVPALEESNKQYDQYLDDRDAILQEWEVKGDKNLQLLREKQTDALCRGKRTNYIGERVAYLRKLNKQTQLDICQDAGISKSTMIRCEEGDNVPTEKTLRKIIKALFVSVADFACFPDDFDEWKASFEKSDDTKDIYVFARDIIREIEEGNFSYKTNGIKVRVPNRYVSIVKELMKAAFNVLNLLPHDEITQR